MRVPQEEREQEQQQAQSRHKQQAQAAVQYWAEMKRDEEQGPRARSCARDRGADTEGEVQTQEGER